MSNLTFGAEFENRTGAIITAQSDLAFRPLRWKAAANGGPVESEIQVTGTRAGLKALRDWLRYPVAVYNPAGSIVWWGFVYEVALQLDGWSVTATLDRLRNRVGRAVFDAWFADVLCRELVGSELVVTVPAPVHRNHITQNFENDLATCAAMEFPGVTRARIELRKPPRAA